MLRSIPIRRCVYVGAFLVPLMVVALGLPAVFAAGLRSAAIDGLDRLRATNHVGPGNPTADGTYSVTVEVSPSILIANSGATAQITATVINTASQPISGVILSGLLNPIELGAIDGLFAATDVNGHSVGTWTVGNTVISGVLSVGDGSVTGTASLAAAVGPLTVMTVSPTLVTITVGGNQAFNARGIDAYGNSVATAPAWATNGGAIDSSGRFTATTIAATGRLVTATQDSVTGTAMVNVVAGPPARLVVLPSTAVISAGLSVTYTAIAYDAYNNLIGNVTTDTVFNLLPTAGGVFVGNAVTPTLENTYRITGTYGTISSTAMLTVTPAAMSRLAIENSPAGTGSPISNTFLSVYDTLTAYAASYDAYDNLIGAVPATWVATAPFTGRLSPTTGISTVLTPAPILTGTGVISAAYSDFVAATGPITVQLPILKISQTANPDPVQPGDDLQYTLIYTNAGNVTAQNVIITETYPAGANYTLASPLPTNGSNVWSVSNVVPGASAAIVVSLRVTDSLPVGSVLTNVVTMSAAKSATAADVLTTPVVSAPVLDLSLTENLDPVRVGNTLVYVIQYRNNGNSDAHSLRITETYPSEITYINAIPAPLLTPTVGSHVWLLPELAHGSSGSIIVTVGVDSPLADLTSLNNQAAISSVEIPTPTIKTQSTLVQSPILTLTNVANVPSPRANSLLTYTLQYTNSGSTYATSVVVTDTVPTKTVFQGCAPIGCIYNPGNRLVTWNVGQVSSGEAQSLTMTVRIDNNLSAGTVLTNAARIAAFENVSAEATLTSTVLSQPAINLDLGDNVSSAAAGDVLNYTLMYTNAGTAPAQNVVITNRIPSNTAFRSCSGGCVSVGNGVYSFTLGTVDAAHGGMVSLGVQVNSPLIAGVRALTSTAVITTATPGDDPVDNLAQDVDLITTVPRLALSVDFDKSTPFETKIITYTLMYTNTSDMDTTGVAIAVAKSPYVGQLSSEWSVHGDDSILPVGNLAAREAGVATYAVSLPVTFTPAMASFINPFVISDDGPGGLPIASAAVTAELGVPDLVIDSATLSPTTVTVGTPFTATVVVRNAGLGRACNPNRWPCTGYENGLPIGGYFIDIYIDPLVPPMSFPFSGFGNTFSTLAPLDPGVTATVVFTNQHFTLNQRPILYFKVDNYDCPDTACAPSSGQRGFVPESNEENNVYGPVIVPRFQIYLPLIRRS